MYNDPYAVVDIVDPGDDPETRGSRTKFWVRFVGEAGRWLLKFPRPGTGEHWAEKAACEIGHLIGVECAQVELARYFGPPMAGHEKADAAGDQEFLPEGEPATICKSFLPGEEDAAWAVGAFHGWEVLQYEVPGYDTELVRGQRDHNVKNIVRVVYELMTDEQMNPKQGWQHLLKQLASYALLDGLIGNTDRHHENWMVAFVPEGNDAVLKSMPSYDHASSLGRELTDERRRQYLESDGVLAYLRRGRGGVYGGKRHGPAPSPLALAETLCRWQPDFTRGTLDRIEGLTEGRTRTAIGRIPPEFMSDVAREFAVQVVRTSRQALLRSAR